MLSKSWNIFMFLYNFSFPARAFIFVSLYIAISCTVTWMVFLV